MNDATETTYRWSPGVACRTLDGTAFILLGSRMLSLNGTGSRIWELLETATTIERVAGTIAAEFATTPEVATADTTRFVNDLLGRQLLVPQPGGDGPEPATDSSSGGM